MAVPADLPARFWAKVDRVFLADGKPDFSVCWPWRGALGTGARGQYGKIKVGGRVLKAHRVAFWVHYGRRIPSNLDGCHGCDRPTCCNPTHIYPGSHRANVQDWYWKRRNGLLPRDEPAPRPNPSDAQYDALEADLTAGGDL